MKLHIFGLVLIILISCKSNEKKDHTAVHYKTYHNVRFDYAVNYPDFLEAKGEADNGDGQKFISKDLQFWVYADFKLNPSTGDPLTLSEAFQKDTENVEGLLEKKINEDGRYYFFSWKKDDRFYKHYTFQRGSEYFTLYFDYPSDDDQEYYNTIIKEVSRSFSMGNK